MESIFSQSFSVEEIVIGDDCSSDSILKIAEGLLADSNLEYKIIRNKKNLGFRKNFEQKISHTTGDIIFLSDQDDVVDRDLNVQSLSLWKAVMLDKALEETDDWKKIFLGGGM